MSELPPPTRAVYDLYIDLIRELGGWPFTLPIQSRGPLKANFAALAKRPDWYVSYEIQEVLIDWCFETETPRAHGGYFDKELEEEYYRTRSNAPYPLPDRIRDTFYVDIELTGWDALRWPFEDDIIEYLWQERPLEMLAAMADTDSTPARERAFSNSPWFQYDLAYTITA